MDRLASRRRMCCRSRSNTASAEEVGNRLAPRNRCCCGSSDRLVLHLQLPHWQPSFCWAPFSSVTVQNCIRTGAKTVCWIEQLHCCRRENLAKQRKWRERPWRGIRILCRRCRSSQIQRKDKI